MALNAGRVGSGESSSGYINFVVTTRIGSRQSCIKVDGLATSLLVMAPPSGAALIEMNNK